MKRLALYLFLFSCQVRDSYVLGIFPSQRELVNYEDMLVITDDFSKLLKKPVQLYIGKNYDDIEAKMKGGVIDFAFVPALIYTQISDNYEMVLKFLRNGKGFYKGQVVVLKNINDLSELKNKNWAFPDRKSASGYLLAKLLFYKMGIDPDTFFNYQYEAGSHDKAMELLLKGNVQVATTFEDIRERMKEVYPDIFEKTKILYYTDSIPNDGFAISRKITGREREVIINKTIELVKMHKNIFKRLYGSDTLVKASDKEYDIIRQLKIHSD
ncbi:MAG: phosphate/phosphite/phosphonate ABC transporter substrate-binding protein [candidate division WOR-3 bacterium]|nr:phosphate/phosphite/phosphonate ABC transporter substrate-binding protein [candidate division WOR-3 bacterium]MCX7948221.1 phosphate/phosphite/phosphonate ABC transporter substrate-binding protein [candidate division WOR-3 bacterium]MDW8150023.1 phosphate/phosphite/phosphonate ABC transporter substrate-binding protein [candidate division WOR-3 bacterium]